MRNPLLRLVLLASTCVLVCSCASSAQKPVQEAAAEPLVPISQHVGFSAFTATLRHIVKDRRGEDASPQHFYVADFAEGASQTWMFWLETQTLWKVPLGSNDVNSWLSMRYPTGGQIIELPENAVADRESVGSSTYLVTERWAKDALYQTLIKGELVTIPPAD